MGRASRAILSALAEYLRHQGRSLLSYARLTGQKHLLISLRNLWGLVDASYGYPKVELAYREALSDEREREILRVEGVELVEFEGEPYLKVSVERLERLVGGSGKG